MDSSFVETTACARWAVSRHVQICVPLGGDEYGGLGW